VKEKICKGVKGTSPLAGFGAEPRDFDPAILDLAQPLLN
jgi:hypothetical protein